MERISIFNYEAFYLDYLEGNLNEEDTALFLAFLEANPDLRMEDDILPSFDADDLKLDAEVKNDLKQPALDETITFDNAEYFMIAETEGLLEEEKVEELERVVGSDEGMNKDRALYGKVHLEPDMSVRYADKEGLQQKVIVLWRYVSVAAAASIIAFFLVWSSINNGPVNEYQERVFAKDGEQKFTPKSTSEENEVQIEALDEGFAPQVAVQHTPTPEASNTVQYNLASEDENKKVNPINGMDRRPVGTILVAMGNRDVEPIVKKTFTETIPDERISQPRNDMALVGFNEMENPIEPLTKFVEKKTNTKVDFRREKKKGFFLKIGKFELSRKRN